MTALGLGRVKTPTFNLRVEIPSRFRKFENQKCLRSPLREDDRENNSAHSWLVHVFTQPGSKGEILAKSRCFPLCPRKRTQIGHRAMSERCHHRKSVDFSITSSVHSSLPKHLGSISKRPARFSSSHDMAPIAFLGACFWVDGQEQS